MMKVKPIGERVLVKREEVEDTSAGGIILTHSHQDVPAQGEVRAVGTGIEGIEVGDTIIFGKYAGTDKVQVDDETLAFIDLNDIKAVIYD